MDESGTSDRWVRIPIAVTIVLIGVLANGVVDMIAEGEFSQRTGYRGWVPYGIYAIYYPKLMHLIRWLVPLFGLGVVITACRRQLRTSRLILGLCLFALVAAACVAIGMFMTYGLYSLTHHFLGG
jgi:hypothetical protein